MSNIPHDKVGACNAIIHAASVAAAAAGAGLAQLPCSDSVVIAPIQVAMTISLGSEFGLELDESAAKSAVGTALSTAVGRGVSQLLLGWIPGFGNILNAATAASVTEGLGWTLAEEFARKASA